MGETIKMGGLKWWQYLLIIGVVLWLVSFCTQPLFLEEAEKNRDTGEYLDENWNDTVKRPYDLHGLEKNNEK